MLPVVGRLCARRGLAWLAPSLLSTLPPTPAPPGAGPAFSWSIMRASPVAWTFAMCAPVRPSALSAWRATRPSRALRCPASNAPSASAPTATLTPFSATSASLAIATMPRPAHASRWAVLLGTGQSSWAVAGASRGLPPALPPAVQQALLCRVRHRPGLLRRVHAQVQVQERSAEGLRGQVNRQ